MIGSTVPLFWDANSEPDLLRYNVYRSLTSGSGYSVIGTTPQAADPISFTDPTPLPTGYYVVTAVNTSGLESGFSNQLCVQVNVAPVITAQAALTTREEPPLTITLNDLTVIDPDNSYPDDFTMAVQDGVNYTRSVNTITPVTDFTGNLTVPVSVNDGAADSNVFNLSLTVVAANAPVITAQAVALTTEEETPLTIKLNDLTANDPDNSYPDDFTMVVQDGANYTRSVNTITPVTDFTGNLTVPVSVNDGSANSNVFNLSVTVTAVNDAPVITAQAALTTREETPLTITLNDLTVIDPDNSYPDDFTMAVQDGVNYTRSLHPLFANIIFPVTDFTDNLTVPVSVNDGSANSNVFNFSVTVTAVNDAPVITAQAAALTTGEETFLTITLNDMTVIDPDNSYPDDFTMAVQNGVNYTRSVNTLTPVTGFTGNLTVPVSVNDSAADSNVFNLSVVVSPDADKDGVPDSVEDQAPNNGDGNNDGIPDSQQANVASLPDLANGRYATLVSQAGTNFVGVRATGNPSAGNAPAEADFVVGFFDFTVRGVPVGQATTVTLFLDTAIAWNTYWKFGTTPGNPMPHWYECLYDGTVGAEMLSDRVILHLVDGERGDDDLVANGEIRNQGGPAFSTPAVIPATLITGVPSTEDPFVGMAILNPNDYPNEVFLSVVDSSGTEVNSIDLEDPLPARGQTSFLTREVLSAASSDLSIIARGADGPIQSFFLIGDNAQRKLDGVAGEFRASGQLYFPIVRLGNDTSTLLFVFNPGIEDVSGVAFRLLDQDGGLARIDHRFGNEGDFGRPERFSESFAIDPVQVE